jgi:hypothetical protein
MATKPDKLRRTSWLYHFTDARNIPLICELDGLWSTAKLREMGVEFHPGGNQHSLDADEMLGMDQYVHLCFTKEHPMAHIAKNDGRIEKLQWIYIDDPPAVFEIAFRVIEIPQLTHGTRVADKRELSNRSD